MAPLLSIPSIDIDDERLELKRVIAYSSYAVSALLTMTLIIEAR